MRNPEDRWDLLCELLAQAEGVASGERTGWLASVCAGDAALQEQLERLLEETPVPASFLPVPIVNGSAFSLPDTATLAEGQRVASRFRIEAFVGRGGMGEVYRAYDEELRETVALKTIRQAIATPAMVDRFRTEIQLARRITHPNVCRIFDIARHPAEPPVHFFSMEFLPGQSLLEALRDGPLPMAEAVTCITQILSGLEAAHSLGIVHGDIKSANIMLVAAPKNKTRAVIMDFGLACVTSPDGQSSTGVAAGTPAYMAPEQLSGASPSPAMDVYAAGILLHELLTGSRPNGIESLTELLTNPPKTPPTLAPGPLRRNHRMARIILRAIQPDPAHRFVDAGQMLAAVEERSSITARRAWMVAASSAGAATLIYRFWPRELAGRSSRSEEASALYLKGKLHLRRLTTEDLRKSISYFDQAIRIDPAFALPYSGRADAYSTLTDYGGASQREAAEQAVLSAQEAVRVGPELVETHASLGFALSSYLPRWREAETSFQRAIQLDRRHGQVYHWYGGYLIRLADFAGAHANLSRAAALDPVNLSTSATLGFADYFAGKYDVAIQQGLRTTELDPNFRYGYLLLARAYTETGDLDKAIEACETGIRLSGNAPVFVSARACIALKQGRTTEARASAASLIARRAKEYIPALYIATLLSRLGDVDSCFQWLEAGWRDWESSILLLRAYPHFDAIRGDSRYMATLGRFNLLAQPR